MATIKKFEDLEAWQKAYELYKEILKITSLNGFAKDFDLKRQVRRSSGSIMDNIAEGFERGGKGEFIQFLGIAKGSAGEVKSQLYRMIAHEYINQEQFNNIYKNVDDICRMISGLIGYLNSTDIRGQKYKKETQKEATNRKQETQN